MDAGANYRGHAIFEITKLIPILALLLFGCATTPSGDSGLQRLQQVTAEDIRVAETIARNAGDQIALACYRTLQAHLEELQAIQIVQPVGIVSGYEAARVVAIRLRSGIPEDIHVACAPLVLDAAGTAAGLGAILH